MNLPNLHLDGHPTGRSRTLSKFLCPAGKAIFSTKSFTSVLLPSEKGRRCDGCHVLKSADIQLRKCSGCASHWYCGATCQNREWKVHHRKVCAAFNRFTSSLEYQKLAPHEKMDALLLSQFIAGLPSSNSALPLAVETVSPSISKFMELLPGPTPRPTPPVCPMRNESAIQKEVLDEIYARFGNNNFTVHSHLRSFAHGIFPLASRLFNHSCVPNAAAKYILSLSQPAMMVVVALRDIHVDEEVCISYVDPALLQSRQQIFRLTYGFNCTCPSCSYMERVTHNSDLPSDSSDATKMERLLCRYIFSSDSWASDVSLTQPGWDSIPDSFRPLLQESYLASLSERFSQCSHEGPYGKALEDGYTLLALYLLVYPPNYPQIGMHALEVAKTAWNAFVTGGETEKTRLDQASWYLGVGRRTLAIFGSEGDSGGPLEEIESLQILIDEL